MGLGPVPATTKALAQAGLSLDDIDLFEVNEPFAVQVLTWCRELGIDPEDVRLNPYGGAIACGHPLAATGVRLVPSSRTRCASGRRPLRPYGPLHRPGDGRGGRVGTCLTRSSTSGRWRPRRDAWRSSRSTTVRTGRSRRRSADPRSSPGNRCSPSWKGTTGWQPSSPASPSGSAPELDINEFPEITPETAGDGSRAGHELFLRIRALPFPPWRQSTARASAGASSSPCTARPARSRAPCATSASPRSSSALPRLGRHTAHSAPDRPGAGRQARRHESAPAEPAAQGEGCGRARPCRPAARAGGARRRVDRLRVGARGDAQRRGEPTGRSSRP